MEVAGGQEGSPEADEAPARVVVDIRGSPEVRRGQKSVGGGWTWSFVADLTV